MTETDTEIKDNFTIDDAPPVEAKRTGFIATFPGKIDGLILKPIYTYKGRRVRPGYYSGNDGKIYSSVRPNTPYKELTSLRNGNGQRTLVNIPIEKENGRFEITFLNIARLIIEAFARNPDPELFSRVTHIDRNPENNALDNLAYLVPAKKRLGIPRTKQRKPLPFDIDDSRPTWQKSPQGIRYGGEVRVERWKPVPTYDDIFASSWGAVYDAGRGRYSKIHTGKETEEPFVELRASTGKKKKIDVALLVFRAWVATDNIASVLKMKGVKIVHLNGDPHDVHLNNLALVTKEE